MNKYEVKPIRTIQGYIKGFAVYLGSERIEGEPFWSEPGKATQAYNQAVDYCNWLNSENEEMS